MFTTVLGSIGCAGRQPLVVRDDATITTDVQGRISADADLKASGIKVDTKAGIVSLTGSVHSDVVRNGAERVARETPGVRSVDNDLVFGMADVPAAAVTR
jgi:osmotically-inducible protein OsmY